MLHLLETLDGNKHKSTFLNLFDCFSPYSILKVILPAYEGKMTKLTCPKSNLKIKNLNLEQ
jgi:hypothetical protein